MQPGLGGYETRWRHFFISLMLTLTSFNGGCEKENVWNVYVCEEEGVENESRPFTLIQFMDKDKTGRTAGSICNLWRSTQSVGPFVESKLEERFRFLWCGWIIW